MPPGKFHFEDKAVPDPRWAQHAACRGMGTEAFFPQSSVDLAEHHPKSICQGCPVRMECLEHALENHEQFGIWGGTSVRERRRIQAGRRRANLVEIGRTYEPRPPQPHCACGCGLLITSWNARKREWSKYKLNHQPQVTNDIGTPPSCACGCGLPVTWNKMGKCWNQWRQGHATRARGLLDRPIPPIPITGCQ